MQRDGKDSSVKNLSADDAQLADIPPIPRPTGGEGESATDRKQDQQIEALRKKSTWAIVLAVVGPVIALGSCATAVLQWKAADEQVRIAAGQLRVMESQLKDARDGAAQARKDTDAVVTAAKSQATSMGKLVDANKAMAEAANISAGNSNRIARGSEEAVGSARDSMRLDQRAWVGVTYVNGKPTVGPFEVKVGYRNSGKTPAMNLRVAMNVVVVPIEPEPRMPDFGKMHFAAGRELRGTILHPNTEVTLHGTPFDGADNPAPLTEAHLREIDAEHLSVFVRGRIDYFDAFGLPHWETFCFVWYPPSEAYAPCKQGNAIDG